MAEDYVYNSPYAFAENRVSSGIELEGLEYAPPLKPGPNGTWVPDSKAYAESFKMNLEGEVKIGGGDTFGAKVKFLGLKLGGHYDDGTYNYGFNTSDGIIKERTEGSAINIGSTNLEIKEVTTFEGDGRNSELPSGANSFQIEKESIGAIFMTESEKRTPIMLTPPSSSPKKLTPGVGWQNVGKAYSNAENKFQSSTVQELGPVSTKVVEASTLFSVDIRALIHIKVEIKQKVELSNQK